MFALFSKKKMEAEKISDFGIICTLSDTLLNADSQSFDLCVRHFKLIVTHTPQCKKPNGIKMQNILICVDDDSLIASPINLISYN